LDPKTSRRIFDLARDQQDELGRPDAEEDEVVIEDDFTRPRNRDLELVDEEDEEEEEEQFLGFTGDEERELVRGFDRSCSFFFCLTWRLFRKSTKATFRRSTRYIHPTLVNAKLLPISYFQSSKAVVDRPPSYALLIDVRCFHTYRLFLRSFIISAPTPIVPGLPHTAPGDDEAPDPAEGLDPKVVEVYTKCVPSRGLEENKRKAGSTLQHCLSFGDLCHTESASFYIDTAPAPFPNRSRSSPLSPLGRAS
jgi:hypothetical protein